MVESGAAAKPEDDQGPQSADLVWGSGMRQSFRVLGNTSRYLEVMLESDGRTPEQVLAALPYDAARAGGDEDGTPDPKRYRDARQVCQSVGLAYEEEGQLHLTDLGHATRRWLPDINERNAVVLARHAALALAACQLRKPGRDGDYDERMQVFPFAFIWRALLALGGRISSDELNRAILRTTDGDSLERAIGAIRTARVEGDPTLMGDEVVTGRAKNDRVIPWVTGASFGWTLICDKTEDDERTWYRIRPGYGRIVEEAASLVHRHRLFADVPTYVRYVSAHACLPRDLR